MCQQVKGYHMHPPTSELSPGGAATIPTSEDGGWNAMAFYVLKELERLAEDAEKREVRLTKKIDKLTDKLDTVTLQGAVTHAKVVFYGAVGGGVIVALLQAAQHLILGGG